MATPLTDFLPPIEFLCLGVPEATIQHALRMSCIEFAERSKALRTVLDPIPVAANQFEVEISLDDVTSEPYQVVGARLVVQSQTLDLVPITPRRIEVGRKGTPASYWQPTKSVVQLYSIPDAQADLILEVATRPKISATSVDDRLMADWRTGVVAGALAVIYQVPNTPVFNPQAAALKQALFDDVVTQAYKSGMQWGNRAVRRTQPNG